MRGAKFRLLCSCLSAVLYVYILVYVLTSSVTTCVVFFTLSGILFFGIANVSLRAANCSAVDSILGPKWGAFNAASGEASSADALKIIAHRACGIDAPENSMSALARISQEGIRAVEFDVMLTSDNVPVVHHDTTMTRMAGDSRLLETVSFKDLQHIDISINHPFGKCYKGEKIPTLKSFIEHCLANNVTMLIDLKDVKLVPAVIAAFRDYPRLIDMALVSSFNPLVIYKIRAADGNIVGCLAWRPYYYSHAQYAGEPSEPFSNNPLVHSCHLVLNCVHQWLLRHFLYHILGLSALLLHKDIISRDEIDHWKKRNVRVLAWTVNSPSEKVWFERALQVPYLTDTVICR